MATIDPYLTFDGTCAEAMRFYEKTLGAKLEAMMTWAEMPDAKSLPGAADRIMHASLTLEGGRALMAADSMPGQPHSPMSGFHLSLGYPSVAAAQKVFDAMSAGGQVTMPLQKTFWTEGFGMLVDRFGTPWMFNVAHG